MWRDLWEQHRSALCFAVGMACFLAAGLMIRNLPSYRERYMPAALPEAESSSSMDARQAATAEPLSSEGGAAFEEGGREEAPPKEETWFLYITGSVRKPGVYELPPGARLFQLVEAAGGLSNFADSVAVNLAAPLEDGMHIHVPKKGEQPAEETTIIVEPHVVPGRRPSGPRSQTGGLVDVNTATVAELLVLKGVGPALAESIVECRTKNGRFRDIYDLLRVDGIGDGKLEGFREQISVGR